MKKKIIQSKLTKNNNLSKTKETEKVLEKMVDALNDHRIEDIGEFFSSTFNWFGNYGCGTKKNEPTCTDWYWKLYKSSIKPSVNNMLSGN